MQIEKSLLHHAEEIAAEVWHKMGRTNLAEPAKLGTVPQIQFKTTQEMDGMNGLAWSDHVDLNADRLADSDAEAFLQEVIRHELSHVAEFRLTGIMGHGPLWHALCLAAGGKGTARSSFCSPLSENLRGFFMTAAVLESAALFCWGICALHAPFWCALTGTFAGLFFPPVCWALFCKSEKSLGFTACGFTIAGAIILLTLFV